MMRAFLYEYRWFIISVYLVSKTVGVLSNLWRGHMTWLEHVSYEVLVMPIEVLGIIGITWIVSKLMSVLQTRDRTGSSRGMTDA